MGVLLILAVMALWFLLAVALIIRACIRRHPAASADALAVSGWFVAAVGVLWAYESLSFNTRLTIAVVWFVGHCAYALLKEWDRKHAQTLRAIQQYGHADFTDSI